MFEPESRFASLQLDYHPTETPQEFESFRTDPQEPSPAPWPDARPLNDAYSAVTQAAVGAGVPAQRINEQIREMIASTQPGNSLMKTILARHLSS